MLHCRHLRSGVAQTDTTDSWCTPHVHREEEICYRAIAGPRSPKLTGPGLPLARAICRHLFFLLYYTRYFISLFHQVFCKVVVLNLSILSLTITQVLHRIRRSCRICEPMNCSTSWSWSLSRQSYKQRTKRNVSTLGIAGSSSAGHPTESRFLQSWSHHSWIYAHLLVYAVVVVQCDVKISLS